MDPDKLSAHFAPKKGKEATKGQKQIEKENQETLKWYVSLAVGTLLPRLLITSMYMTTSNIVWTCFALFIHIMALVAMYYTALPGVDLNLAGGFGEKLKDIILSTSICSVITCYSNWFWFLMLWLPAYYVYKLWVTVIGPWIFQPAPEGPPPEVAEKKRKKMERKMARQSNFR